MPKLFPIHIEVEEVAVGRVLHLLSKMRGVAKLNLDIEHKPNGSHGPSAAKGKPRPQFEETGQELVCNALYSKPPMTRAQLIQYFATNGRSGHSVNSVLHKMRKDGEIQLKDGDYTLTAKIRDRMRHRKARKEA
jgi:CRP-like cAMP-binding protein